MIIESLVDYVLERGRLDYGEFAPKDAHDPSAALYNHRKLLAYLFQEEANADKPPQEKLAKRISDLKIEQISGQLNYFSQKIHAQLSKKHLTLDGDLYRVENEWLRKKMPDFYCYYFLKFAYANSYARMHEIFLGEIENMAREKDSYAVVKKTIEAREACLSNLRRMLSMIKQLDVEESLHTIREERELKRKLKVGKDHGGFKERGREGRQGEGKSWKNELELLFENINHLRKLTCYVTQLIRVWRVGVYGMSDDPRRYRQRVIFYHHDANYLLKMLFDANFIRDSLLQRHLRFSSGFDPFCLKPAMLLDNNHHRSETEDIFFELVRPSELDMDKIAKALVVLAEEEYDEDQQSRFLHERKNYGELEQRKQFIQRRRDTLGLKKNQSEKVLPDKQFISTNSHFKDGKASAVKEGPKEVRRAQTKEGRQAGRIQFSADKRSGNTQRELQEIQSEKQQSGKRSQIETSLNRLKQMRAADLKKVSPYLSRNERIEKAQKVIELEHKFRVAQSEYVDSVRKKKEEDTREKFKSAVEVSKESLGGKIFNRYIEENLKMMEDATKKSFLYKNHLNPAQVRVASSHNYNQLPFHDRKEAEYERNLEKYYPKDSPSPSPTKANRQGQQNKGTKAIIEISNKGVKANEKIIEFELTNRKGKNLGAIINSHDKMLQREATTQKLQPSASPAEQAQGVNLFSSQKQPQILIIRQQPQKLEQIKQFLYAKIKEELMEEMKRNAENKQVELNNMIEDEKRRKLQEIIDQRRLEEERRRQEEERQRLARLDRERKKLSFDVRIEPIQYAEENLGVFFEEAFGVLPGTYHRLFTTQKVEALQEAICQQFYYIFLKGYWEGGEEGFCVVHFEWEYELHRKLVIDYLALRQPHLYLSTLHRVIDYLWAHDPVQEIELVAFQNLQNAQGVRLLEDLVVYASQTSGQVFEKQLYSNVSEVRLVWMRPSELNQLQFPFSTYHFGKRLSFKAELLSAAFTLSERHSPLIDMTLEVFTNYVFLLEELFRRYLTPEEVVELRENSTNIRRLKDIFRIVLDLEKTAPVVDELAVVEGLNLDDLYSKLREKKMAPYEGYYWHNFYDRVAANRLLLAVLQLRPQLKFPVQTCLLNDRKFLRVNCRQKVLVIRSSVYAEQAIYILETHLPKVRMFVMGAEHYKLMRMQLFVFLNLVFNNIIEDGLRFVNCIWLPQWAVTEEGRKRVKRVTDFSISMKKSFFLAEEIYFANEQYIKAAASLLPKQADVLFQEAIIFGFLHSEVEQASTGMPLYAKLVDRAEMF